jgi:hypothetical protein
MSSIGSKPFEGESILPSQPLEKEEKNEENKEIFSAEVLVEIFSHLPIKDLQRCSTLNKDAQGIVLSASIKKINSEINSIADLLEKQGNCNRNTIDNIRNIAKNWLPKADDPKRPKNLLEIGSLVQGLSRDITNLLKTTDPKDLSNLNSNLNNNPEFEIFGLTAATAQKELESENLTRQMDWTTLQHFSAHTDDWNAWYGINTGPQPITGTITGNMAAGGFEIIMPTLPPLQEDDQ